MNVLRAVEVTAGYAAHAVLAACTFEATAGEVVAIVGPNGAGKSTLLRVLAGLLRPASGQVLLDGRDIGTLGRREIARRIAVVPQIFDTLFPFTVREIVALGRTARLGAFGRASATDARAVDEAMTALELEALASRRVDRISGGERQRAVLAMAIAQEPVVLLLDEPTVHLDPARQIRTLSLLRALATERGLAIVAVVHDLNLAAAIATRVVILSDGCIVRDAAPREALDDATVRAVFGPELTVARWNGDAYIVPAATRASGAALRTR